jgi:hypothetical protein
MSTPRHAAPVLSVNRASENQGGRDESGFSTEPDRGAVHGRNRVSGFRGCDVSTARSLNGDSYLHFWWNTEGQCLGIIVRNNSMYSPK